MTPRNPADILQNEESIPPTLTQGDEKQPRVNYDRPRHRSSSNSEEEEARANLVGSLSSSSSSLLLSSFSLLTQRGQHQGQQQQQNVKDTPKPLVKYGRFDRQADTITRSNVGPCIIKMDRYKLDVTNWARAHPGGIAILKNYHNGDDATKAFIAVGHSTAAYTMLPKFLITNENENNTNQNVNKEQIKKDFRKYLQQLKRQQKQSRIIQILSKKLMTKEDPYHIHKCLGLFCLCHFIYRFYYMIFDDPCAGMCNYNTTSSRSFHDKNHPNYYDDHDVTENNAKGSLSIVPMLCLIPHALLSLSSLMFHTVPKERIVGKPMIWQEFRIHNICFGIRSLVCCFVSWISIYKTNHVSQWRFMALVVSGVSVLGACYCADMATLRLRKNSYESTTATMPYWYGCSQRTQRAYKHFYALSQFGATVTCIMVCNPSWPFAVLLPIQGASFLMTLVRKNIIHTKTYHVWYSISLLLVFVIGIRQLVFTWNSDLLVLQIVALTVYQLRRMGLNKYMLWIPIIILRILIGDTYLHWDIW